MGREFLPFIFLILLPVALVWANPPTLNTISDLRTIEFGHRFPRHGLHLLYFIAHELIVDDDYVIIPTFVPDRGDWGFVSYSNSEGVFPPLPDYKRQGYYSVGNLNPGWNLNPNCPLPSYVTQNYRFDPRNLRANMDRVVIRTRANSPKLEELYITQHYLRNNTYDPDKTFRISPALLREIRTLSANWVHGLTLFLFKSHYDVDSRIFNESCYPSSRDNNIDQVEDASGQQPPTKSTAVKKSVIVSNNDTHIECYEILLEIKATDKGYARIRWSNIPDRLLDKGVQVNVYKEDRKCFTSPIRMRSYGTYDTSEYLNKGLSPRLQFIETKYEIMRGPTYDDTDRKLPVDINGYNAGLQLYTKDGYACARLIINNKFIDWQKKFYYSWVGFYCNHNKENYYYDTYQWPIYFQHEGTVGQFNMYVYCSDIAIRPEAQARFFESKEYVSIAKTIPWER